MKLCNPKNGLEGSIKKWGSIVWNLEHREDGEDLGDILKVANKWCGLCWKFGMYCGGMHCSFCPLYKKIGRRCEDWVLMKEFLHCLEANKPGPALTRARKILSRLESLREAG
ncbi:MAG: hypothetical protein SWK76_17140 [Actinomycetota bacterium]|nr:hypothetical protein [Actinomycetota bacterium]